jgi:hypothetical protein
VIVGFFSLIQFVLCVRAVAGCVRERFRIGIAGGIARLGFMLLVLAATFSAPLALIPGSHQPAVTSGWAASAMIVGAVGGPVVSFGVLAVAHIRSRNVPMAEEERLGRPFMLWLPVGVFDAIYVALQLCALWFLRGVS